MLVGGGFVILVLVAGLLVLVSMVTLVSAFDGGVAFELARRTLVRPTPGRRRSFSPTEGVACCGGVPPTRLFVVLSYL